MATAQNESLLKNTRSMLRSVLLSAPRGVRARYLEAEYRGITGKIIPYRELGYRTLKEFMSSLQDVARLSTAEVEPVYYGMADSSTAHIAKMVAKQKKPKKTSQPLFSSPKASRQRGGHYRVQRQQTRPSYHKALPSYKPTPPAAVYQSVSQTMSQPERIARMVEDFSKASCGVGAYATRSWKEKALRVNVTGYVSNTDLKNVELIQMCGYIQSAPEEHTYKGMPLLRTLLCSSPELVVGKGQSVMCHFFSSDWKSYQGPRSLTSGQKLVIYGRPSVTTSAKYKESMAVKVLYYENATDRLLIGSTVTQPSAAKRNTTDISYTRSDVSLHQQSPFPSEVAVSDEEMEQRIYQIVKEFPSGVYFDRVKVLYLKKYCSEIAVGKISQMTSLRIDEPIRNMKILYPVKLPQQLVQSSDHMKAAMQSAPVNNVAMVINELPSAVLPKIGGHLKVLVTHVEEGPGLFYVHLCCDETMEKLQVLEYMTGHINKSGEPLDDCRVGQFCAALYKDNSWNRAVITEVKLVRGSKLKSLTIQYVDFGNTANVSTNELRKLPAEYWNIPIQAIACTLLLGDDVVMDNEAIVELFTRLSLDSIFFIDVTSVTDDEILTVDMYQEKGNTSVASLLQDMLLQDKPSLPDYVQPTFADDENCCMDVYVTLVESPASFYVQFVGEEFSDKLFAMETAVYKYYSKDRPVTLKSFEANRLALYIEDDQYNRALLLATADENHVTIQLVDYGHTLSVTMDKLFILPYKFWKLPFQGRQCFLYECADFVDTQQVTEEFTTLAEEKRLVALIVDSSSSRLAVQLSNGDDTNINNLLKSKYSPISELSPKLPEAGKFTRGVLTNVDLEGTVTLQLAGPGTTKLKEIEQEINNKELVFVKRINVGLQCVAKCSDKYYRAEVAKIVSGTEAEVILVDYGVVMSIEKLKLRLVNDGRVWSLPYQAVTCHLDNLPPPQGNWTPEAADYLKQKCADEVTIEATQSSGMVKLYLENSDDEEDVNDTLYSSPQLFGLPCKQKLDGSGSDGCHGNGYSSGSTSLPQLSGNHNSHVLPYQLLDCDEMMENAIQSTVALQADTFQLVKVTHVSISTDEFAVQLISHQTLIEHLQQELQQFCESTRSSFTTETDLLTPHGSDVYCAVKHNGVWYRGRLIGNNGPDILVALMDYGQHVVVSFDCVHHLHPKMAAMPMQAMSCRHYDTVKEGLVRPSAIIPGNLYHCFPYFQSKHCYVVSLVDYETKALIQSS